MESLHDDSYDKQLPATGAALSIKDLRIIADSNNKQIGMVLLVKVGYTKSQRWLKRVSPYFDVYSEMN